MEMKNKRVLFIAVLALTALVTVSVFFLPEIYAKMKYLKYLPQNQFVEMTTKDIGKTLYEVDCPLVNDLFKNVTECENCIKAQGNCPDCCLTSSKKDIACTPEADSKYNCSAAAFVQNPSSPNNCSEYADCVSGYPSTVDLCADPSSIDCQKKGCGTIEPDGTCDGFLCDEDNLKPKSSGCTPTSASGLTACSSYQPYSSITEICTETNPNTGACVKKRYQYVVNPNYQACINTCNTYVDAHKACRQQKECCSKNLCGSGFQSNCALDDCKVRLKSDTCANYTSDDCAQLKNTVTDCLLNATGECHKCFMDIDQDWAFKFVAKSREKIVVIWQLTSTPLIVKSADPAENVKTYFYTMVKVFDDVSGELVHDSFVSQKSFSDAFSVFAATNITQGLEPGRRYRVKLYYFIPKLDKDLKIQVDKVQMIVVRIRE